MSKMKLALALIISIWLGKTTYGQEVETYFKAMKVTPRPVDITTGGAYSISGTSGTIAAGMAANGVVMQMRWTNGSAVALIEEVRIGAASGATGFAAGQASCGLVFARSYTTTGTTGSNSITTGGSAGKRRTNHASSLIPDGDLRISATAAATGQVWTLDTADLVRLGPFGVTTGVQTNFIPSGTILWARNDTSEWPIVLAQNEGIAVRCTVPATGVWVFTGSIRWIEVPAF